MVKLGVFERLRARLLLGLVVAALSGAVGLAALAAATRADANGGAGTGAPQETPAEAPGTYSAVLEQCLSPLAPTGRAATFVGEMWATPTTARMRIKIELQERTAPELRFRTVDAPSLGVWSTSTTGVGVYKDMRQVTNLAGATGYRAVIFFQWLDGYGRLIKRAFKHTPGLRAVDQSDPAGPPLASRRHARDGR